MAAAQDELPDEEKEDASPDDEVWRQVDAYVHRFERAWQNGARPDMEDFLPDRASDRLYRAVLIELAEVDLERRLKAGEPADWADYIKRYPQLATNPTVLIDTTPHRPPSAAAVLPNYVGRYKVDRILGRGGFGTVYLAYDDQLQRQVAIKVPHAHLVARPEDAETYLTEARIVAGLDHPNIVPVYDVGTTAEHPFFIVSKFIEGSTLAQLMKEKGVTFPEAAELVRAVAETLHFAHKKGLVHRDIKPGNILLEWRSGQGHAPIPYVADFGLALREQDFGKGSAMAGTPAYLSPEQARGEGHRVDGRSDIFSLGIVLYELLTGKRPFKADTINGLLDQIRQVDVRPPRQRDDSIPKELERICLKALARRASERYSTALDLADDLRHFLLAETKGREADEEKEKLHNKETSGPRDSQPPQLPEGEPPSDKSPSDKTPSDKLPLESRALKIVPKGLRSFDDHDADFFLDLIPGPRDRSGMPDSLRFWKAKIEEKDEARTFTVGLMYGPSGCGKSSLVKAGLLPRLSADVISVYVEAAADQTEARVLASVRKRLAAEQRGRSTLPLPPDLGLRETLTAVRRGQGVPAGKKVLLVLDQFEQWLHTTASRERLGREGSELIEALRQCDGARLQCIVMVRDDFWLAVSRFLRELEVPLIQGQNSALVDLFDTDHAKRVLAAFGRAYGRLPEAPKDITKEQRQFLQSAVSGLAQEGQVISVRLALFAEMMKGEAWTPSALKARGGISGVGATFLEKTFSAATAPPEHRCHQQAARNVLKALLPDSGTDIKGHMRSYEELLEVSGYRGRAAKRGGQTDFDDLLRILDSQVRLITPTDPEGDGEPVTGKDKRGAKQRYYQLTHDYLVHSLRDWLTRKQKETRRGRAELLLADCAATWNAQPKNRQLATLLQWLQIRLFTRARDWTPPQRKMMRRATVAHALRTGVMAVLLMAATVTGLAIRDSVVEQQKADNAAALVGRLFDADIAQVPEIVRQMKEHRIWTDPLLKKAYAQAQESKDVRKQLHASLALLPVDRGQVEFLYGRLLEGQAPEVLVIRDALLDHKHDLTERLWTALANPANDRLQLLRAGCALAAFAPDDEVRWKAAAADVAALLVTPEGVQWAEGFKSVGMWLVPSLFDFVVDEKRTPVERRLITTVLRIYATEKDYENLERELSATSEEGASLNKKLALAKRQATIGIALIAMDRAAKVWPLLKHPHDPPDPYNPTLRSFLIEVLTASGLDAKVLASQLSQKNHISVRRAVLLSLSKVTSDISLLKEVRRLYAEDPDPGVHGAAEWLLRQWGPDVKDIDKELKSREPREQREWYINDRGHTMMIIPSPGVFWMGEGKNRRQWRIARSFAIASKEVTVEQFELFRKERLRIDKSVHDQKVSPGPMWPANNMTWYQAAEYCNWLSEIEGIPKEDWCYEPNEAGKFEAGMKMKKGYLRKKGYRLPTEAEWEYACRAGANTSFSFGDANELLREHAVYVVNAFGIMQPVGSRKPNDFGLFDMHGNAIEWTQHAPRFMSDEIQVLDDEEHQQDVLEIKGNRVLRGGSFQNILEERLHCAVPDNFVDPPSGRSAACDFRPVRTWTPGP